MTNHLPSLSPLPSALKTGGVEVQREKWDEAEAQPDPDEDVQMGVGSSPARSARSSPARNILPDWTRTPLPVGAPPAPRPPAAVPLPSSQEQMVIG